MNTEEMICLIISAVGLIISIAAYILYRWDKKRREKYADKELRSMNHFVAIILTVGLFVLLSGLLLMRGFGYKTFP